MAHLEMFAVQPLPEAGAVEVGQVYQAYGVELLVEYRKGDTRTKMTPTNARISSEMPAVYGCILKTNDKHGDEIDFYLAENPQPGKIAVLDQVDPGSKQFDEHKVMLGFESVQEALATYMAAFSDGSGKYRIGAITVFSQDEFLDWLSQPGSTQRPASVNAPEAGRTKNIVGVAPYRPNAGGDKVDEAGGVRVNLPDLSRGPKLVSAHPRTEGIDYTFYLTCALETTYWSNVVDTLVRKLDLATEHDVFHIRIASRGGSVLLMGRIYSAIKATKGKVITYARGTVASAATTVWAAGHQRVILPGAYFMQHMSSQGLNGKTNDIVQKAKFCAEYISKQLNPLIEIGVFTQEEVATMIGEGRDIYISGRTAIERCGEISGPTVTQEKAL